MEGRSPRDSSSRAWCRRWARRCRPALFYLRRYAFERSTNEQVSPMKTFRFALTMAVSLAPVIACAQDTWVKHVDDLSFQTHSMWSPRFNLSAGTVMVYGIDATLPKRIES